MQRSRSAIGWLDVPLLVYNNIFVLGEMSSRDDLASTVDKAIENSKGKKHPGMITVCHDLLSGLSLWVTGKAAATLI